MAELYSSAKKKKKQQMWKNKIAIKKLQKSQFDASFLFPHFFLEQNKPLCPKRSARPHQRAVWGREEEGFNESGVRRTAQEWSHHNVWSSILQQPRWICHEQICLLRLLQVQKGLIFTSDLVKRTVGFEWTVPLRMCLFTVNRIKKHGWQKRLNAAHSCSARAICYLPAWNEI